MNLRITTASLPRFVVGICFAFIQAFSSLAGAQQPDSSSVLFLDEWKVPVTELPLIAGSPKAKHWIIVYSKWNCQICGLMHHAWQDVLKDLPGDQVGVVMLPAVSYQGVDPLQRTMLAVWRANPKAYDNVATMIWANALSPNDLPAIRRNLADFMGGEAALVDAEKNQHDWVEKQIALSGAMLKKIEKLTNDTGSYPKMTNVSAARMGHLGTNASYRQYLVALGYADAAWAQKADAADPNAQANPGLAVTEHRKKMAPHAMTQIIDLGNITNEEGATGQKCTVKDLTFDAVSSVTSNHGSLRATPLPGTADLTLHLTWVNGLGPGPWETVLFIKEKSGQGHLLTVKGVMKK